MVVATSLALAALPANAVSLQLPLPHAQPVASEGVTLLKCDGRNYEQACVSACIAHMHLHQSWGHAHTNLAQQSDES